MGKVGRNGGKIAHRRDVVCKIVRGDHRKGAQSADYVISQP